MEQKINRRKVIKAVVAGGVVVVMPGWANIIIPKQPEKLGVALVGLGYYSKDLLAPALQLTSHCKLTGIVTGSPEKIPVWQKRYGIKDKNVYNYENMSQIADNPDIDVIYIVLPTGLHSRYGVKAADTGKHVWCEKPMAKTQVECQMLIDACRKNKVKLSIGYRMHHEPNTQTIMKYANTKPFGRIVSGKAEAGYFDGRSNHWKQNKALGGGAMYDMGVYALNAARYSTGKEPIGVTARHETTRPDIYHEVDETTYFDLEFPDNTTMQCITSLGKGMNELKLNCQNGWYGLQPFQAYSGIKGEASNGYRFDKRIPNQQAKQMDDDALAILKNTDVLVPGEEGQRDIRIVEAIYQSAKQGRRVAL